MRDSEKYVSGQQRGEEEENSLFESIDLWLSHLTLLSCTLNKIERGETLCYILKFYYYFMKYNSTVCKSRRYIKY